MRALRSNNYFLIVLFVFTNIWLAPLPVVSQTNKITNIAPIAFHGFHRLENRGFYSLHVSEESKGASIKYLYTQFNSDLEVTQLVTLTIPREAMFEQGCDNGKVLFLIFHDRPNEKRIIVTIDSLGNVMKQRTFEEDLKDEYYLAGKSFFVPDKNEGIYIVQNYLYQILQNVLDPNRSRGYRITLLNNKLNEVWVMENFPKEEKAYDIILAASSQKMLVVVRNKATVFGPREDYNNMAIGFARENGEEIFMYNISGNILFRYPTLLKFDDLGNMLLAGHFLYADSLRKENPDGMFLFKFNSSGRRLGNSRAYKNDIKKFYTGKETRDSINRGLIQFAIQDVVKQRFGYTMIAQAYYHDAVFKEDGLPISEMTLKSRDFIIMNYDQKISKLGNYLVKTPVTTTHVTGRFYLRSGAEFSNTLTDNNLFAYKLTDTRGTPRIIYYRVERMDKYRELPAVTKAMSKRMLLSLPVGKTASTPSIIIEENEFTDPRLTYKTKAMKKYLSLLNAHGPRINEALPGIDQVEYIFNKNLSGVVAGKPGTVVLYDYNPAEETLTLKQVQLK